MFINNQNSATILDDPATSNIDFPMGEEKHGINCSFSPFGSRFFKFFLHNDEAAHVESLIDVNVNWSSWVFFVFVNDGLVSPVVYPVLT
jgi:hypothetical protein